MLFTASCEVPGAVNSPPKMLSGIIDGISASETFRLIGHSRKTGLFRGRNGEVEILVTFVDGEVVFVQHSGRSEGFERRLVTMGAVTESQLARVVDDCKQSGKDLATTLVTGGFVERSQLDWALIAEIEDAVAELFSWREGTFTFETGAAAGGIRFVSITVHQLVAHHTREAEELARLRREIPATARFALVPTLGRVEDQVVLRGDEWQLLALVDGRRTAAELVLTSNLSELQTMRILRSLVDRGVIEMAGPLPDENFIDLRERRSARSSSPPPPPPPFSRRRG
jgi:hypothetical protein